MKKVVLHILLPIGALLFSANLGFAASSSEYPNNVPSFRIAGSNCVAKANQIAAGNGDAEILSVEDHGDSCTIVIRIPGVNGNPPRIISQTVSG